MTVRFHDFFASKMVGKAWEVDGQQTEMEACAAGHMVGEYVRVHAAYVL